MNKKSKAFGEQIDMLQLYELLMNIGQSLDLKENCEAFFRVLIRRKNLGLVSLWLWGENAGEAGSKTTASLAYISPGFRKTQTELPFQHDSFVALLESTEVSVAADSPVFKRIAIERVPETGIMAFFRVGAIGIVKLFFFDRSEHLSVVEANQLQGLFSKFSVSLQACIEHERLKKQMVINHRLALAINQSDEMVIIFNRHLVIEYCNAAFEKNYALHGQEIIGQAFESVLSNSPFFVKFMEIQPSLILEGRWQGRVKNFSKTGGFKDFGMLINPVFGDQGEIVEYVVLQKDVTLEVAFEERRSQSQKLESIGTLAGGIAHEFNNLLAVIMGNIELLTRENSESELSQRCLGDAYEASRRAQELVRKFLLFSRNETPSFIPVPIDKVVSEAVKKLRSTISSSIEVETQFEFRGFVKADPGRLQQVILNLCKNSIKAITGAGKISLRLSEAGLEDLQILNLQNQEVHWICLSVIDNGCGIPSEIIGRVFDPFFSTQVAGEGTGLGLSVVHGIVQQLGGSVTVESVVGKGSVFKVFLPLTDVDEYFELPPQTVKKHEKCRLLVVDDEKLICSFYQRGLTRAGYQVEIFDDSIAALKAFSESPGSFDAVVTDMMMPGMTGDKLSSEILKIRPDMVIILCSGYLKDLNKEDLYKIGIKAFIEKPMIVSDLIKAISRFV